MGVSAMQGVWGNMMKQRESKGGSSKSKVCVWEGDRPNVSICGCEFLSTCVCVRVCDADLVIQSCFCQLSTSRPFSILYSLLNLHFYNCAIKFRPFWQIVLP